MARRLWATTLACILGLTVLVAASGAKAALYDYKFTFASDAGTVIGVVRGLMEGTNSVNTIEVLSHSSGFGVGTYTHNDDQLGVVNWTVTGGAITAYTFMSFGGFNSSSDVTDSTIFMTSDFRGFGVPVAALDNSPLSASATFSQAVAFEKITPVPVPLPAALLGSALLGLGLIGARRRRPA